MSTAITLPGGVAILKDDAELTNKQVKFLRRAAREATSIALELQEIGYNEENPDTWNLLAKLPDDAYERLDIFQRTCVIVRLQSWTLDLPMPTTVDEVDDLPRPVVVPLLNAAADIKLTDDFEPTPEAVDNPLVVTANSDI